jgi:hypothetical protein
MADIPGLSSKITEKTLIASTRLLVQNLYFLLSDFWLIHDRHNRLPPDSPFPQIDVQSDDFKEICAIIAKHNAQRCFRLRLLHRHMTIPEGHILFGKSIAEPLGYWTCSRPVGDIDLQNIHGHIFSVDMWGCTSEGEMRCPLLFPSEFREAPAVGVEDIDGVFFTEFSDCVLKKGLADVLGLEVMQGQAGKMVEFSFDIGSLLLREEDMRAEWTEEMRGRSMLRDTGWAITVEDGAVYQTGETRCVTFETGHVKITNGQVKSMSDVIGTLRYQGVLCGL